LTNLDGQNASTDSPLDETRSQGRDIAIDYLRAFVIVLVVLLHAALAYTSFGTYDETHWVDSSAPVVDTVRWPLLDWVVGFLDGFFMPLLFLVSGLFVISSLTRRGSRGFFVSRLRRLGIPFVFGALVLAPWAFLPSYLMASTRPETPYLATFFTSDGWPVGPPWFLWVLLVFSGVVALVHRIAPNALGKLRPPKALVISLVALISFLPLRMIGSHFWWISLGPFDAQPIRLGLYFAYFLLGMALGTGQQWQQKNWPKLWGLWLFGGTFSLFFYMALSDNAFSLSSPLSEVLLSVTLAVGSTGASLGLLGAFRRKDWSRLWGLWLLVGIFSLALHRGVWNGVLPLPGLVFLAVLSVSFAVGCAGTILGVLGASRKLVRRLRPVFDSLGANSFSIYLIHYGVVLWIQFALLSVSWPAWVKFGVAFTGGCALSWGASALIRKIPAVHRVL
jgi:glucan biosynthesis protein C